tara:strand:+ start:3592 stop:4392 length:801 start_codon:yes stop_codon:yes gene_type:complete
MIDNRSKMQMNYAKKIESVIGDFLLETIKPGTIKSLCKELYPKNKASSWNRSVIRVASAIINCAAEDEHCSHIRISTFKEEEVPKKLPSDKAGEILLQNTEGIKQLYIAVLHYHGLRPSDALSISWDNINMKEQTFQVVIPKAKKNKEIVMDQDFFVLLANVPKKNQTGKLFPWKNRSSLTWLNDLTKKLGVTFAARKARHKFATDLAAEGASEFDLVNCGSWTSTRSTKTYVTLQPERAKEMLKRRKNAQIVQKTRVKTREETGK